MWWDEYYFHEYMAKEKSRLKELDKKIGAMETTYEMWKKEARVKRKDYGEKILLVEAP